MLNRIIPVTTIALLLIACAIVPALAAVPIGQTAPDFQLNDLSGNAHKLSSFQGKVVVIDFFENTCGGCQDDAKNKLVPLFNNYYKNNANVQFLSVEVTGASAAQIQSTYLTATGTIPWPILTNGQTVWTSYNTGVGVPTLYVIDPAGKVAAVMQYPTDVQKLKSTIDQYAGSGGFLPNTGPAVSSWAAERLDVFMVGTDHALWHKWYQSGLGWSAWESLGGSLTSSPAAVSWSNGRIDVFARGSDGTLQHKWFSGGWSGWESLGGQLASGTGPAVSSWAPGRLDIFTTGTDGALKHLWFSGGWHAWESLGGSLTSSPAAVSWDYGRIDIFARGSDGALKHLWFSGGWSNWESLGGQLASGTGPAVSSWAPGRLDIFTTGTDGALKHLWFSGGWSNWESLGGSLTSSPAAVSWGAGRIDVFARGSDGIVNHKWFSAGWYGWESLGGY